MVPSVAAALIACALSAGAALTLAAEREVAQSDLRTDFAQGAGVVSAFVTGYVDELTERWRAVLAQSLGSGRRGFRHAVGDLRLQSAVLLGPRGRSRFAYPRSATPRAPSPSARIRPAFDGRAAISATGRLGRGLVLAVPVGRPTGRTVFVGRMDTRRTILARRLPHPTGVAGATIAVVDPAGTVVAPAGAVGSFADRLEPAVARAVAGRLDARVTEDGLLTVVAPVAGTPWSVVARAPLGALSARLQSIWVPIGLWLAFSAGVAAIVLLFVLTTRHRGQRLAALTARDSARSHLDQVAASISEGIVTLDATGHVTYVNQAAERLLGHSAAVLSRRSFHDVVHRGRWNDLRCDPQTCPLVQARSGATAAEPDGGFLRSDETALAVSYTVAPIPGQPGSSSVVFQDITDRKLREAEIEEQLGVLETLTAIRNALDEGHFTMFAQPVVDLETGRVAQHELLLRLIAEDGEVRGPGAFMAVAEQHGTVREIDRWVMAAAMRYIQDGHAVHVNLSAVSLGSLDTFHVVERELRESRAEPDRLIIEITETAILESPTVAVAVIERLRALGCRIALDDFGTGYAGFNTLKNLPVDYVKIDREFVKDLVDNEASRHVVRAVVDLARRFGCLTIAEGVEDQRTLELLGVYGVDMVQGYFLGMPADADAALTGSPGGPARGPGCRAL